MNWNEFCKIKDLGQNSCNASFETATKINKSIIEVGKKWMNNPKSLFLSGECGTGKTFFMYCLIRELLKNYHLSEVSFYKSCDIDERITRETKEYGSCDGFVEILTTSRFLFLDDFGIEKATEKTEREYYKIIDKRVDHEFPTIISSNLTISQVKDVFGSRIASRILTCKELKFIGKDIRASL